MKNNSKSDKFKTSPSLLRAKRCNPVTSPLEGEVGASLRVRGKCVVTNNRLAPLAPVCNVILRRYSLLEVPWRRIHNVIAKAMAICVAYGNKVMDTRLPQPAGCGDKYDVCYVGRSMIEMLGVLAIIAVLSVSGLAGYSKAMEKYKLIKYREGMVELISNFLQIKDELPTSNTTHTLNYPEIMHEMGLIPAEFEYVNRTTLKDRFGVTMNIFHDGRPGENHYNFAFHFTNSRLSSLACHELLETVIEFRNDVHELYRQPFGVPSGADYIPYYRVLGSRFCVKGKKCLSNLTMNDIHEICYYYKGKSEDYVYAVQFYFKD